MCLSAAPFIRACTYGLVNLDDYDYLTMPPVLGLKSVGATLSASFTDLSHSIWMPLTWLCYALDYALFGDWYGGFHLHSILVHAVNAVLFWQLLRQVFADQVSAGRLAALCFAGAAVWAVHPLRCESVVLLSSRKDVLSLFWELLALIAWTKGSRATSEREPRWSICACGGFVVGAMCKPSVMTFPALCLVLDAFVFRRVRIERYVKPLALAVLLAAFASWQQHAGGALAEGAPETLVQRLADSAAAFGVYIRNTLVPTGLAAQCAKRWPELPRFLAGGCVIGIAYGLFVVGRLRPFVRCWRRKSTVMPPSDFILAGLLWFAIAIVPMLGLIPFGYHAFADRFTYIPSLGLSIVFVALLARLADRLGGRVAAAAAVAVLVPLGAVSVWQTGFWKDDFTVAQRTLAVDGERNSFAHLMLGHWYFEFPHDVKRSVEHFNRLFELDSTFIEQDEPCYVFALCENGEVDKAMENVKAVRNRYLAGLDEQGRFAYWSGGGEGRADVRRRRFFHDCDQAACWLEDPVRRGRAVEWLARNDDPDNPLCIYLRLRLAQLQGDAETVARCRKAMAPPRRLQGYFNLRWLQKK